MDVVNFLEEYKRMCESFENCASCPLLTEDCDNFRNSEFVEKAVPAVEAWAAAHPHKTRQSVFLEQWPNAQLDCCGIVEICPSDIDTTIHQNCSADKCGGCRREFWMQEVE